MAATPHAASAAAVNAATGATTVPSAFSAAAVSAATGAQAAPAPFLATAVNAATVALAAPANPSAPAVIAGPFAPAEPAGRSATGVLPVSAAPAAPAGSSTAGGHVSPAAPAAPAALATAALTAAQGSPTASSARDADVVVALSGAPAAQVGRPAGAGHAAPAAPAAQAGLGTAEGHVAPVTSSSTAEQFAVRPARSFANAAAASRATGIIEDDHLVVFGDEAMAQSAEKAVAVSLYTDSVEHTRLDEDLRQMIVSSLSAGLTFTCQAKGFVILGYSSAAARDKAFPQGEATALTTRGGVVWRVHAGVGRPRRTEQQRADDRKRSIQERYGKGVKVFLYRLPYWLTQPMLEQCLARIPGVTHVKVLWSSLQGTGNVGVGYATAYIHGVEEGDIRERIQVRLPGRDAPVYFFMRLASARPRSAPAPAQPLEPEARDAPVAPVPDVAPLRTPEAPAPTTDPSSAEDLPARTEVQAATTPAAATAADVPRRPADENGWTTVAGKPAGGKRALSRPSSPSTAPPSTPQPGLGFFSVVGASDRAAVTEQLPTDGPPPSKRTAHQSGGGDSDEDSCGPTAWGPASPSAPLRSASS